MLKHSSWLTSTIVTVLWFFGGLTHAQGCPQDFAELSSALAKDLHHYLNRSYSKFKVRAQAQLVSLPNREPLPIKEPDPSVYQLFLTIPHRQAGTLTIDYPAYWLFFVTTPKGWKLAMAFTKIGDAPPLEVSDGALGDALKTWLRDYCRLGVGAKPAHSIF